MIADKIVTLYQEKFENAVAALLVAMAKVPVDLPKPKCKVKDKQPSTPRKSATRSKSE